MWITWAMRLGVLWALGAAATFFTLQLTGHDDVTSGDRWAAVAGGFGFVAVAGAVAAIAALLRGWKA